MPATTKIHRRMLELLIENPQGLSITQIRKLLDLGGEEQQHLDRRMRDLDGEHEIERVRRDGATLYVYKHPRETPRARGPIKRNIRGQVLLRASGACAMCGRTIAKHGITLQIDHIIPVEWGGSSAIENLQALCEEDNAAKKAFFAGFDQELMRKVFAFQKVHQRIGQLLVALHPTYVESFLLEAVAAQDDWRKRLRELRTLGWKIEAKRKKQPNGRVTSAYRVEKWNELSDDPAADVRRIEKEQGSKR
ncbi:MAG TPA: HNH endonuclease signature motif containing protein [Candidatus Angelobacter sp.]